MGREHTPPEWQLSSLSEHLGLGPRRGRGPALLSAPFPASLPLFTSPKWQPSQHPGLGRSSHPRSSVDVGGGSVVSQGRSRVQPLRTCLEPGRQSSGAGAAARGRPAMGARPAPLPTPAAPPLSWLVRFSEWVAAPSPELTLETPAAEPQQDLTPGTRSHWPRPRGGKASW